jgi:hypothetical protein
LSFEIAAPGAFILVVNVDVGIPAEAVRRVSFLVVKNSAVDRISGVAI